MDITTTLSAEFSVAAKQVENTIALIDEGNTIPFIARYRKEMTGSMDDQKLRELYDRLIYLRNLTERKDQVRHLLEEQGNLTPEISGHLTKATTLTEVEDIYRPFRPKRRTRATIAEEKGLGPFADILFAQELNVPAETAANDFINPEKGVETAQDAVAGACDIIAERISDDPKCRAFIRDLIWQEGIITSVPPQKGQSKDQSRDQSRDKSKGQVKGQSKDQLAEAENEPDNKSEGQTKSEDQTKPGKSKKAGVYDMYFEYSEPIKKIVGHRILALNRGERENWLKVAIEAPAEKIHVGLKNLLLKNNPHTNALLEEVIADSYKRLIAPSAEREIRTTLTEQAMEGAIKVFGENLRQLLMQAPVKDKIVLAIDPGFRTGCKLAVVDETGRVLETGVVYCTIGKDVTSSKTLLKKLMEKYKVEVIAIGNGTASRETEKIVADLLREEGLTAKYIIVNEAGASVYSASKLGAQEFPDFDVSLRSAVSIGRRLQDPLAELVKIDPKSIGVGQYQHDMNQKRLNETLSGVVESCVNAVGVDLNTASASLLSYVAGVSSTVANQILAFREEKGKFTSRQELLKVKKLGPKAFEQCAGFLRIPGGVNPLDNTGVHPESYVVAEKYLKLTSISASMSASISAAAKGSLKGIAEELSVGLPTLLDIVRELEKPGRDPREDLAAPLLRSDILSLEDLQEGMILKGTVRNVIDFGAFVDIGVHQDGLVHISQMSNQFISHPLEAVKLGDVIDVKVQSIDLKRQRISLTMKF